MVSFLTTLPLLLFSAEGFVPSRHTARPLEKKIPKKISAASESIPTLSGQPWKINFALRIPNDDGSTVERKLSFLGEFRVEEGYEPPQGKLVPLSTPVVAGSGDSSEDAPAMEEDDGQFINQDALNRWVLSEDPDDRKDGLWIWGLFEEPLYPFCLLQLTFKDIPLSSGDIIPGFTTFAQIDHVNDRKTGEVQLRAAEMTVKKVETLKADIAGLASFDYKTDEAVGTVRFTPVV